MQVFFLLCSTIHNLAVLLRMEPGLLRESPTPSLRKTQHITDHTPDYTTSYSTPHKL